MAYSDPWYLTIVRTQGIQFLRPEKSWRPIVSVNIDSHLTHETILGCDGQNPNLKNPFVLRDVDLDSRFDIQVWHKSSSRNRRKRHLIGSAYVQVKDVLRRQDQSGCDIDIRLTCPPPQKRSPNIGAARKMNSPLITLRLRCPVPVPSSSATPLTCSSSVTAVELSAMSGQEDEIFSDSIASAASPVSPTFPPNADDDDADRPWQETLLEPPQPPTFLRRRTKPKKVRGYCINTTDEEPLSSAESCASSSFSCPPSPRHHEPLPLPHLEFKPAYPEEESERQVTIVRHDSPSDGSWFSPRILPVYIDQMSIASVPQHSFTFAESLVDRFSPYRELTEATEPQEFERILARMLTEWYVVGGSLLAIAGLFAAVFGLNASSPSDPSSPSDSTPLFTISPIAYSAVIIGSIATGLGILTDASFLLSYSSASPHRFRSSALDVYQTYFFFSLTCRLPAMCMFVASSALMVFLLAVAYEAWSEAVLVMAALVGVVLTLQYLIFGIHRMVNMVVWGVRRVVWAVSGLFFGRHPPPVGVGVGEAGGPVVCSPPGGGSPVVVILNGRRAVEEGEEESAPRPSSTGITMPIPEPAGVVEEETDITICVEREGDVKDCGES